eukprot:scaffold43712_cov160-Amphora_coffeaeformis.AAC.2
MRIDRVELRRCLVLLRFRCCVTSYYYGDNALTALVPRNNHKQKRDVVFVDGVLPDKTPRSIGFGQAPNFVMEKYNIKNGSWKTR